MEEEGEKRNTKNIICCICSRPSVYRIHIEDLNIKSSFDAYYCNIHSVERLKVVLEMMTGETTTISSG